MTQMNIRKLLVTAFTAVLFAGCFAQVSGAVTYAVQDLGVGTARNINNSGQVIINGGAGATFWSESAGFVPLPMTYAWGLNDNGKVVGETAGAGVLWNFASSSTQLFSNQLLYAINNQGQMAGMSIEQSHWKESFFRNSDGAISYLGNRFVQDINNLGEVAGDGIWTIKTGWSTLPGIAYSINESGQVAGKYSSQERALLWSQSTGTTDIGALFSGADRSYATGINDFGQVVGYWNDVTTASHAFFWSTSTGVVDLSPLAEDGYSRAFAINNLGQIIGESNGHAVLWTPVPEPTSVVSLLGGLVGFLGIAMKRRRG